MKKLIVLLVFAMLVVSSLGIVFTGIASADAGYEADLFLIQQAARGEVSPETTAEVKKTTSEEKEATQEYRVFEPTGNETGLDEYDQISADAGPGF